MFFIDGFIAEWRVTLNLSILSGMKLPEDHHLVWRLNKGDKLAFEAIYKKYHEPLFLLGRRYLKDPQLAEDAVQDVFSKLWIKRTAIDCRQSLQGFLFTSLRNHVLNMVKINKRRILRQIEYANSQQKESLQADEEVIFSEAKKIVEIGVRTLPERKKLVFELKNLQGYSNQEIADRMGISIHTVRSQYQKASKAVQKFVFRHIH